MIRCGSSYLIPGSKSVRIRRAPGGQERGQAAMAAGFEALLDPGILKRFGVGTGTVADVFARVVMAAPEGVPQVDIATGIPLPGLAELPQGSVSRASGLLVDLGLLTRDNRKVERPGRPIIPLKLSPDRFLVGVWVQDRRGHPPEVVAALAPLDGTRIESRESEPISGTEDLGALVEKIANVVTRLMNGEKREVLGVGVKLGRHVHQGSVITGPTPAGGTDSFPLGEKLSTALRKALPDKFSGMPTIVDNDVNARAVLEIWTKDPDSDKLRFPQPHFAVVTVFDDRVGGALVIDRKVYRGSHGMAGEIGHLTVDHARPQKQARPRTGTTATGAKGFNDPCPCAGASAGGGGYGHVDALATPARIAAELGIEITDLWEAAQEPGTDEAGHATPAGDVFATAGEALGRGIAALLNIANPGNLLVLLPQELAESAEGTAAALYTQAIENALDKECFSTAAADARAGLHTVRIETLKLGKDPDEDQDLQEIRPTTASVLDSFIAYARGEDTESLAKTAHTD